MRPCLAKHLIGSVEAGVPAGSSFPHRHGGRCLPIRIPRIPRRLTEMEISSSLSLVGMTKNQRFSPGTLLPTLRLVPPGFLPVIIRLFHSEPAAVQWPL